MAMRSQTYEWSNVNNQADGARRVAGAVPQVGQNMVGNVDVDIFIGGIGNNITMPAQTTATQFVVLEEVACTPAAGGACQVRINTTDYFQNPDVTDQVGITGQMSPYPRGAQNNLTPIAGAAALDKAAAGADDNSQLLPSFNLYPDVYVLPGQVWTVLYNPQDGAITEGAANEAGVAAFIKYTLYDGPDALIANKLLEMGVTINPNNVDWYKRTLIEQQSAASMAAASNGGGN